MIWGLLYSWLPEICAIPWKEFKFFSNCLGLLIFQRAQLVWHSLILQYIPCFCFTGIITNVSSYYTFIYFLTLFHRNKITLVSPYHHAFTLYCLLLFLQCKHGCFTLSFYVKYLTNIPFYFGKLFIHFYCSFVHFSLLKNWDSFHSFCMFCMSANTCNFCKWRNPCVLSLHLSQIPLLRFSFSPCLPQGTLHKANLKKKIKKKDLYESETSIFFFIFCLVWNTSSLFLSLSLSSAFAPPFHEKCSATHFILFFLQYHN